MALTTMYRFGFKGYEEIVAVVPDEVMAHWYTLLLKSPPGERWIGPTVYTKEMAKLTISGYSDEDGEELEAIFYEDTSFRVESVTSFHKRLKDVASICEMCQDLTVTYSELDLTSHTMAKAFDQLSF